MSDIRFACPHCSQHIACDADYCDVAIDCPACGNSMVVPRLTATDSTHPAMVLVASTPAPKHIVPPPIPPLRAWTEQEWARHSQSLPGGKPGQAPHWVLSLFGTLIVVFILRINHAGIGLVIACLILGGALSAVLMVKDRKSTGAYTLLRGLGIAVALCFLLPVVALGVLFIGCMSCR
jgi:hypothetical protein